MKTKQAGLLTRIVVLALLAATAIGLLNTRKQISTARREKAQLEEQIAQQIQANADLSDVVENSDDPDHQETVARTRLGLVEPGERVFIYTD